MALESSKCFRTSWSPMFDAGAERYGFSYLRYLDRSWCELSEEAEGKRASGLAQLLLVCLDLRRGFCSCRGS